MTERGTAIESAPPGAAATAGARFPLPAALVGPALLALLGAALMLVVAARAGPGVTPDSVTYLAAAHGMQNGEGHRAPDGEPYVAFPPLYPTMIAVLSLGGVKAETAARLLDAVSFGVVIVATGWAVGRITRSAIYAGLGSGAVLVSTPILDSTLHIWSESLFTALTMIALGCLVLRSEQRSAGAVTGVWVAGALAALTRYIGVIVPLTHAAVELSDRATPIAMRLRRAAVALMALAPLLLWLGRNLAVSGTLAGERYPSATSFLENAQATAETVLRWLAPIDAPMRVRGLLVILVVGVLGWVLVMGLRRERGEATRRIARTCLPYAVYCALYLLYLAGSASLTALDPIGDRLIAPLLPAAVVLALVCLHAAGSVLTTRHVAIGPALPMALALLWLVASAGQTVQLVRRVDADGVGGYASPAWRDSATVAFVREELPHGVIYSNDPFAIWYQTSREARLSPRRHAYQSPQTATDDVPALRVALESGEDVYLIWFDTVPRDFLLSLAGLNAILELEPIARIGDGAVYRVR